MAGKSPLEMAAAALTAADIAEYKLRHRSPANSANWGKWAHCPKAELWQCVALSFGIEPSEATMRAVSGGFVVAVGPKPRLWFAEHADLRERLQIALANAGSDSLSHLHPLPHQAGDMASRLFSTAEFGDWARRIWPATVPQEFPGQGQAITLPVPVPVREIESLGQRTLKAIEGEDTSASQVDQSESTDQVATAYTSAPEPSGNSTVDREPRVAWRRGLLAVLPDLAREGKSLSVTVVLKALKQRGEAHNILNTGRADELQWKDEQGTVHTVSKKTVSTFLSTAKKSIRRQVTAHDTHGGAGLLT